MRGLKWAISVAALLIIGLMIWTYTKTGKIGLWPAEAVKEQSAVSKAAHFEKLRKEHLVLEGQSQLDLEPLIAAMPDIVVVTHGAVSFDSDLGATLIENLKIAHSEYPDTGIQMKLVKLWGIDTKFIQKRKAGSNLNDEAVIARRIEAENVSLFGLENLVNPMLGTVNKSMTEGIDELDPEFSGEKIGFSVDNYSFEIKKLIIDEFTLLPFVLTHTDTPNLFRKMADSDDDDEEVQLGWNMAQTLAAWHAAYGWKNAAFYEMSFGLYMDQMGVDTSTFGSFDLIGYSDFYGGDLSYALIQKSTLEMDMGIPSFDFYGSEDEAPETRFKQTSESEYTIIRDIRLNKLAGFLARGEMPARSETDLLSFGRIESGPSQASINDKPIYGTDKFVLDLTEFHWLIPEKIEISIDNLRYDLIGYVEIIGGLIPGMTSDAEAMEMFEKSQQILVKHDLREFSFDLGLHAKWSAETGETQGKYGFGWDKMGRVEFDGQSHYPDFDSISALISDDLTEIDKEGLSALFEENFNLGTSHIALIDEGGLERGFAMAIDFANLAPDEPGLAGIRNSTPEKLREIAASSMFMGAGELDKAFPPAVDYLKAFSDFVLKGGRFDIKVHPPEPINAENIEEITALVENDPYEAEKRLGLKVTHTPPN